MIGLMRRAFLGLTFLSLFCPAAFAAGLDDSSGLNCGSGLSQQPGFGASSGLDAPGCSGGAPFVGPLDGTTTTAAYSLRRLYSAYIGKAAHWRCPSGTNGDVGFTASGDFNNSALAVLANGGSCFRDKWYDQSGNGRDVSQATTTAQPSAHTNSSLSGKTCASYNGSQFEESSGTITLAQPFTVQAIANRTGTTSTNDYILNTTSNGINISYGSSSGTLGTVNFMGTSGTFHEPTFHSVQAVINGASSKIGVDLNNNTGNGGATGISGENILIGAFTSTPTQTLIGDICEVMLFPAALTDAQVATIGLNQNSYYNITRAAANLIYGGDAMLNGFGQSKGWFSDDNSFTMTTGSGTDPFSGNGAVNLKEGATTAVHNVQEAESGLITANATVTWGGYLKVGSGGSARNMDFELTDAASTGGDIIDFLVDPSTGAIITTVTGANGTISIAPQCSNTGLAAGWWKCWATGSINDVGATGLRFHFNLNNGTTTTGSVTYLGDGVSNLNVWGPFVVVGSNPPP